jgi:hypothetical protein
MEVPRPLPMIITVIHSDTGFLVARKTLIMTCQAKEASPLMKYYELGIHRLSVHLVSETDVRRRNKLLKELLDKIVHIYSLMRQEIL